MYCMLPMDRNSYHAIRYWFQIPRCIMDVLCPFYCTKCLDSREWCSTVQHLVSGT